MKNLIIALALVGFTVGSANAQTACPAPKGQVCKKSGNGSSCYKTKYAHDFKVCKDEYGYHVCCEERSWSNSTHPRINMVSAGTRSENNDNLDQNIVMTDNGNHMTKEPVQEEQPLALVAPQSQSYPEYAMNSATSYEGYYSDKGRHHIRVCYGGDNVAELNRAAYHGCPTPAYDGPEVNKVRNVNSNNTIDNIAPITGQSK